MRIGENLKAKTGLVANYIQSKPCAGYTLRWIKIYSMAFFSRNRFCLKINKYHHSPIASPCILLWKSAISSFAASPNI